MDAPSGGASWVLQTGELNHLIRSPFILTQVNQWAVIPLKMDGCNDNAA